MKIDGENYVFPHITFTGVNCMPSKLTLFCLQRENGCFMSQMSQWVMSHESMSQWVRSEKIKVSVETIKLSITFT